MPTQEHLKEIAENLDNLKIGLDDTFEFGCRRCGMCCKNREDIILSSKDVFNIAKALNMTTKEVLERYCDLYIGPNSRFPMVRLNPKPDGSCPLLNKNNCIVHRAKPAICALFPLGRYALFNPDEQDKSEEHPFEVGYMLTPTQCGNINRIKVKNWLNKFNIPDPDEFFATWHEYSMKFGGRIRELEKHEEVTEKTYDMIFNVGFHVLYAEYDTSKELFPQFKERIEQLDGLIEVIDKIVEEFIKAKKAV